MKSGEIARISAAVLIVLLMGSLLGLSGCRKNHSSSSTSGGGGGGGGSGGGGGGGGSAEDPPPPPPPPPPPSGPSDIYEPNNTQTSAYPLTPYPGTFTIDALIATTSDQDWFGFAASIGDQLTIDLTSLPFDYDLELYDVSGTLLASSLNSGTSSEFISYVTVVDGGIYYLKVFSASSSSTTDGYHLTITVGPAYDDWREPNETRATAYFIGLWSGGGPGWSFDAVIKTPTDTDWYVFSMDSSDVALSIDLTSLPFDYDLELYNEGGTLIASSTNGGTSSESIFWLCSAYELYYIRVWSYSGSSSSDAYHISIGP